MTTEKPITLFTKEELEARAEQARETGENNFRAMMVMNPWIKEMPGDLNRLLIANSSVKSRLGKLRGLADKVALAIQPFSSCKEGCSHCCNISVAITDIEAKQIAEAIGVAAEKPAFTMDSSAAVEKYHRQPCPFLSDGRCSIYEHRPLACRLHFNIDETPFFCNTDIDPKDSAVPNLNFQHFWATYAMLAPKAIVADIREYFPKGVSK